MNLSSIAEAITASLYCSLIATAMACLVGAPLGVWLGRHRFPGRRILLIVARTAMAMPTVVIGLLLYGLLSRSGPFGSSDILFTRTAIILGEFALALPIVVSLFAASTEALHNRLDATLMTLGATGLGRLSAIISEARTGLVVAVLAAFGRVVSELGIAMMLGGNIRHHTRTMTTAIALETQKGEFETSLILGGVLLAIALLVNVAASFLTRDDSPTAELTHA